jgi:hypothetical protein
VKQRVRKTRLTDREEITAERDREFGERVRSGEKAKASVEFFNIFAIFEGRV